MRRRAPRTARAADPAGIRAGRGAAVDRRSRRGVPGRPHPTGRRLPGSLSCRARELARSPIRERLGHVLGGDRLRAGQTRRPCGRHGSHVPGRDPRAARGRLLDRGEPRRPDRAWEHAPPAATGQRRPASRRPRSPHRLQRTAHAPALGERGARGRSDREAPARASRGRRRFVAACTSTRLRDRHGRRTDRGSSSRPG